MRAPFCLLLLILAQHLNAADRPDGGWIPGPLVEVLEDRSVKEVDEYGGTLPIGYPAFEKLTIRKSEEGDRWIVSGTVCSTNAGGSVQGAAIYAGYGDGRFVLVSMSNLKGEVLFSVQRMHDPQGKPIEPTHLYVIRYPVMSLSLKGAILRKYPLRPTK